MGNTITKRTTTRTSQTAVQWDEANVLRLITEHKLAPKHPENKAEGAHNTIECPICFLDFAILNTVNCCKQNICTDCILQLKTTEAKCACPFCGNAELNVSLIPIDKSRRGNNTGTGATKDRSSSVSESDRSSGSSQVNLSYTTPEQEKKLRSLSVDMSTNVSSRNDREALEKQIREQRLQFDARDLAEAQRSGGRGRGGYYSGGGSAASSANSPFQRYGRIGRYGLPEPTSPGQVGGGGFRTPGAANRTAPDTSSGAATSSNSFVNSIENLLQTRGGATRITSIQQLEDIMLMEAIRLSMQDAETSNTGGECDGVGNNSPGPSASRHSAPASPTRTGLLSNQSANNADHYSPQRSPNRSPAPRGLPYNNTSASSPGRAPGSPNTNTSGTSSGTTQSSTDMSSLSAAVSRLRSTPGGSENSTVTTSAFSFSIADPAPQRSHYAYTFNEEDMHDNMHDNMQDDDYTESDEEEQIRLAMELSLAYTTAGEKESSAITATSGATDNASAGADAEADAGAGPNKVSSAQSGSFDGNVVVCERAYDSSSALDTQSATAAPNVLSYEEITVSLANNNTSANASAHAVSETAEELVVKVSADGL